MATPDQTWDVVFVDEKSRLRHVATLPRQGLTLDALKTEARHLFNVTVADTACEPGHGLKVLYPEDGIDEADAAVEAESGALTLTPAAAAAGKKKPKHEAHVRELKDELQWQSSLQHWHGGVANRRDKALVMYTEAACGVVRRASARDLAKGQEPALRVLGAARQLCSIVGGQQRDRSLPPPAFFAYNTRTNRRGMATNINTHTNSARGRTSCNLTTLLVLPERPYLYPPALFLLA
jgi:hypothetical protein